HRPARLSGAEFRIESFDAEALPDERQIFGKLRTNVAEAAQGRGIEALVAPRSIVRGGPQEARLVRGLAENFFHASLHRILPRRPTTVADNLPSSHGSGVVYSLQDSRSECRIARLSRQPFAGVTAVVTARIR